jgi:hypothetical protein
MASGVNSKTGSGVGSAGTGSEQELAKIIRTITSKLNMPVRKDRDFIIIFLLERL